MSIVQKYFDKLEVILLRFSQFALLVMMVLTSLDALSRYFFSYSITGAYEITERYLMIILVFLSMSYVLKIDGHIRLDILFERFSSKIQRGLNIVFYTLIAMFAFFMGYESLLMTINAFKNNLIMAGLIDFPLWLSYIWIPIGSFVLLIRLVMSIILTFISKEESDEPVEVNSR